MKAIHFIFLITLLISCTNQEDCSTVYCDQPRLYMLLVNDADNTDYIASNQLEISDFEFFVEGEKIKYNGEFLLNEKGETLVDIPYFDSLLIRIKNEKKIEISTTKNVSTGCCSEGIKNVEVKGFESVFDKDTNRLIVRI